MGGEDAAAAWVALRAVEGVGDVIGGRLVARFGGATQALSASASELAEAGFGAAVARGLGAADVEAAAREVTRIREAGARLIVRDDPEYPALLRALPDAPLYLVARGEPLPPGPALAVVGSRHATRYGLEVAKQLAADLAFAGITVVSGLARGIDAAAHEGALAGGGPTLAVLGSGIDVIYPSEHAPLAARIVAAGALLTEHLLGTPPLAEHFPTRNRIIAGLACGTLVVQAAERSGSLITAAYAREHGREVFAVPGPIDTPLSTGTHQLIQEGAKLTASLDDIVSEIGPVLEARAPKGALLGAGRRGEPPNAEPLVALLARGPIAVDELIRDSGLAASEVLTRVLELELRGVVVQLPGNQVQLAAARRTS